MEKFYGERFHFQQGLLAKIAPHTEAGEIVEIARTELRHQMPRALEICILLLDPEAENYTRPIQCGLRKRPFRCQACKPGRPAVARAMAKKIALVEIQPPPVTRTAHSPLPVGLEYAAPMVVHREVLGVISVVTRPHTSFDRLDFLIIQDVARLLSGIVLNARNQWQKTLDKIRISQALADISPFVPANVRTLAQETPEQLTMGKRPREISILFLDLEGYTRLCQKWPEVRVNQLMETLFSRFVDPIHQRGGTINETAGDGLMVIFEGDTAPANAVNAVSTALEITRITRDMAARMATPVPLRINMGINSGRALVGTSRYTGHLNSRVTYTASGPVTNIAARLSDRAKDGDILLGEETRRQLQDRFPVFDRGKVELKGLDTPIQLYSLFETTTTP